MSDIPHDLLNKSNSKQPQAPQKSGMKDMLKNPQYTKNRVYDKKSGTGRGKEISKNGQGGKFTWEGNPDLEGEGYENDYVHRDPGEIKKEFN